MCKKYMVLCVNCAKKSLEDSRLFKLEKIL